MKTNIALILLLLAPSAPAQMPPEGTTTVRINLYGALCDAVNRELRNPNCIDVVYNENDVAGKACLAALCTWTWTVQEPLNPKFTTFSLRLGPTIGRTRCRRAKASNPWNLNVTFDSPSADPPALTFKIVGPAVYYMRDVKPVHPDDVRCGEKHLLDVAAADGTGFSSTVSDVQLAAEDLRLQVYKEKAAYCGVIVDQLLPKGADVSIGPNELAPAIMKQGLEGTLCYAPTLVDLEVVKARFRKYKPVFTVKVVK